MSGRQALLALALTGCGAVFNGPTTKIAFDNPAAGVVYAIDGAIVPSGGEVRVLNWEDHEAMAFFPDGRTAALALERHVSAAAVVCDIIWALTVFGLAAPIADAAFSAWYYIAPDKVHLQPTTPAPNWVDLAFAGKPVPAPTAPPPAAAPKKPKKPR